MFGVHFYICHVGGVRHKLPTVFGSKLHARNTDGTGGIVDNLRRGRRIHGAIFGYGQVESCRNGDRESGHQVAAIVTGAITVCIRMGPRFCAAVTAGAGLASAVLRVRNRSPCTVGKGMVCRFRGAITTGAACRPAVLGIGSRRPTAIAQRMAGVLIGAVATVRTGRCSPVLGIIVTTPGTVGETVVCVGCRADIAATGRTVSSDRMLCTVILTIGGACGVIPVRVGTGTAIVAGIEPSVLCRAVIRPSSVAVGAMADTGPQILTTVSAILIVGAAGPGIVGGSVITNGRVVTGIVIPARRAISIAAK